MIAPQQPFFIHTMAIPVVEFSKKGYKIRKVFVKKLTYPKEIIEFCIWCNRSCQIVPKFDFQSQFFMSKIIGWNLSQFFSLKNINLGTHFLLLTFFDNIDF